MSTCIDFFYVCVVSVFVCVRGWTSEPKPPGSPEIFTLFRHDSLHVLCHICSTLTLADGLLNNTPTHTNTTIKQQI